MEMIYREYIQDRRGEYVKMGLRPMRWRDWLAVAWKWSQYVWRYGFDGSLMDSGTAWQVAEIIVGVVRDVELWKSAMKACGRNLDGEVA